MPFINVSGLKRGQNQPWLSTKYLTPALTRAAIFDVAPYWLARVNHDIIVAAKLLQPRLHSQERVFWGITRGLFSTVYVKGPMTEFYAFDGKFRVPVGGFQYGDINPKTGDPFPGGVGKGGRTYIHLVDKLESHGEAGPVYRARVYNKRSGEVISHDGFLSLAIRYNLGSWEHGQTPISIANYDDLALKLAKSFSMRLCDSIWMDARSRGYLAHIGELYVLIGI